MLRRSAFLLVTPLALSPVAAAQSATTYLECNTVQRGTPMHYNITLNEPAGTADWIVTSPDQAFPGRRDAAQFSANTVRFFDTTISRVDLTMERHNTDLLGNPFVEKGTCRIVTPAKRAF
jgi:hypothetical protein